MNDFFLEIVLFLSLGTIIFMIARALPRLEEGEEVKHRSRLFSALPIQKWDAIFASSAEKVLRKTKVGLLKVDNVINSFLSKIKSSSGNGNGKHVFSKEDEVMGEETKTDEV